MNNNRLQWLDFMKGIAIFFVVLGHVYQFCIKNTGSVFNWIYTFHMPFFFMLSGILVCKTKITKNVIKKRAFSLLIPFFMVGGLHSVLNHRFDEFIYGEFHAGYWFLLSLFFCWLLFIPLYYICKKKHVNKFIECFILLTPFAIYKFFGSILPNNITGILSMGFTFAFYRFFVLGYYLGRFFVNNKKNTNSKIEALSIFVFYVMSILILREESLINYIPITILQVILCLSLFYTLFTYERFSFSYVNKHIQYIGRNSLSIYIFHYFIIYHWDVSTLFNGIPGG